MQLLAVVLKLFALLRQFVGLHAQVDLTLLKRVLQTMEREYQNSHVQFILAQSLRHREAIWRLPLSKEVVDRYARLADRTSGDRGVRR